MYNKEWREHILNIIDDANLDGVNNLSLILDDYQKGMQILNAKGYNGDTLNEIIRTIPKKYIL